VTLRFDSPFWASDFRCSEVAPDAEAWLLSEDDVFCSGEVPFMIAVDVVDKPITELVCVSEEMLGHAYVGFLNRRSGILP